MHHREPMCRIQFSSSPHTHTHTHQRATRGLCVLLSFDATVYHCQFCGLMTYGDGALCLYVALGYALALALRRRVYRDRLRSHKKRIGKLQKGIWRLAHCVSGNHIRGRVPLWWLQCRRMGQHLNPECTKQGRKEALLFELNVSQN